MAHSIITVMSEQSGTWAPGYVGPGSYLHKKGGRYRVIGLGTHEGTGELMVIYSPVGGQKLWVRPLADFDDVTDGVVRFQRVA